MLLRTARQWYRPLVLKLKQLEHGEEWRGKVTYKKTEVEISDPSQVEGEVNKAQNFIAGNGLMISSKLISLEVSSPNVPDLTLIDLPGITRVAVGNQPADIGCQHSSGGWEGHSASSGRETDHRAHLTHL
ncbi:protein Mx1 [Peromyscus maniculatus bairdii]|uniref:protein Mx1 n=1 Tax=Peromyscus maniculatus bairdii TaxID=230844 RepID=UPI003FD24BE1